jgi:PAS domain S-box-containing protein
MTTKSRKRLSNLMLACSLLLAVALGAYGSHMSQTVREQENRNRAWRNIIDHSSSAVIVIDTEGLIVQWSEGAEKMLGWDRHSAEGADLELIMVPERFKVHKAGFCDENQQKLLSEGGALQIEGFVVNREGTVIAVDVRITAVTNGRLLFVAELVPCGELHRPEPSPLPPPSQMQYDPPQLETFRS